MGILKLKLYQETACYKKPFAFKVAETYPLPPYSTVIGMFHKILQAKSGEYFPMNISIQGDNEGVFSNYQTLRAYKKKEVTQMPRNVHQVLNVNLLIHVKASDEIISKIKENISLGVETFTLGRNEDLVRLDEIKEIKNIEKVDEANVKIGAYIPEYLSSNVQGINYRLNTIYEIKDGIRKWNKVNVKYVDKYTNQTIWNAYQDEDGDNVYFFQDNS